MRIIAGIRKGASLFAPMGMNTRPTLDRVKESVFGILQFELEGKTVLDLFAGSGGLGLEALSRGAKFCVFNDHARESAEVVRRNVEKLGLIGVSTVYSLDYSACLKRAARAGYRFDIAFLDPPYGAMLLEKAMGEMLSLGLLSDGFTVVAEHSPKIPPMPVPGFYLRDSRRYGDVAVSFYVGEDDR
ncbi:MAG TPA: 16S rRNA (guanine(966)-N(2))-methyltransferase RsmD [Clostridia bacterium]|nr:16S rRNA (guanine(966)-N(2))-methyltransferase RsmD [Clostridia bacterium]